MRRKWQPGCPCPCSGSPPRETEDCAPCDLPLEDLDIALAWKAYYLGSQVFSGSHAGPLHYHAAAIDITVPGGIIYSADRFWYSDKLCLNFKSAFGADQTEPYRLVLACFGGVVRVFAGRSGAIQAGVVSSCTEVNGSGAAWNFSSSGRTSWTNTIGYQIWEISGTHVLTWHSCDLLDVDGVATLPTSNNWGITSFNIAEPS